MSRLHFTAHAPSNIALVKYMGKDDSSRNVPANPSLSMTLDSLRTSIEVIRAPRIPGRERFEFSGKPPRGASAEARPPDLGEKSARRFVAHAERIEAQLPAILAETGLALADAREAAFELRTANTFPAASGIASSASAFAALTLGLAWALASDPEAFAREYASSNRLRRSLAALSRQGSGSSCRSFEGPFVRWEGEKTESVTSSLPRLMDLVLLVSSSPKEVSSSEAHARVLGSPLWSGRPERARARLGRLEAAIRSGDLGRVARESWDEMWEMHSLFHTSSEPFSYWVPGSLAILQWLAPRLREGRPWIVTMDAGPNVHVLLPEAEASAFREVFSEDFASVRILADLQGSGAALGALEREG